MRKETLDMLAITLGVCEPELARLVDDTFAKFDSGELTNLQRHQTRVQDNRTKLTACSWEFWRIEVRAGIHCGFL
jgi:hypothetical protein